MGPTPLPGSISLTRVGLVLDGEVRMEAWNQVCGVTVMQQSTERQWILGIWVCVCVLAASTALSPHLVCVWVAAGSDGPTTRGCHAADLSRPERLVLPCKQRRAEHSVPGCRLPIRATRVRSHLQLFPTKCRLENFCLRLYFSILVIFFLYIFFFFSVLTLNRIRGATGKHRNSLSCFYFLNRSSHRWAIIIFY